MSQSFISTATGQDHPRRRGDRMKRRAVLGCLAATCGTSPFRASGQSAGMRRLCFLMFDPATTGPNRYTPFFDRLRELGYIVGDNLAVSWLSSSSRRLDFAALAAECVNDRADVIVAATTPAAEAAKRATGTIPIVMLPLGDPVGTGLVANLAKPGANLTGTTNLAPLMMVKGLELLKQTVPSLSRLLVLTYPIDPISHGQVEALQRSAPSLGVELRVHGIDGPDGIAPAFAAAKQGGANGVIVTVESIFQVHRDLIVGLARRHALPSVFSEDTFVKAGGLLSYDADRQALTVRSADYVDKVLKASGHRTCRSNSPPSLPSPSTWRGCPHCRCRLASPMASLSVCS